MSEEQMVELAQAALDHARGTGQSVQLEGNRLPVTHSKDVMAVLTERG
jgi:hypothetical protein